MKTQKNTVTNTISAPINYFLQVTFDQITSVIEFIQFERH